MTSLPLTPSQVRQLQASGTVTVEVAIVPDLGHRERIVKYSTTDFHRCDECEVVGNPIDAPWQPGDVCWIRESWSPDHAAFYPNFPIVYKADYLRTPIETENGKTYSPEQKAWYPFKWRSPQTMKQFQSRYRVCCESVTAESGPWRWCGVFRLEGE